MARLFAIVGLMVLLAGCSTQVKRPELSAGTVPGTPLESWAYVLQHYVNEQGQVDFEGLAKDRSRLDHYVDYVGRTPFSAFAQRDELIAHHINAYNALAMYNVIDAGIPDTNAGALRQKAFFYDRKLYVGGQSLSLYAYENDVIRPLGEERVHFALNCMAVSCPVLPRVPFEGKQLERQLDVEAHRFFKRSVNVRLDAEVETVYFNEILKFYTEDFLKKAPSLIVYANRYTETPIPEKYDTDFSPYDWTVNNSNRLK